jgi:hypothetical protein
MKYLLIFFLAWFIIGSIAIWPLQLNPGHENDKADTQQSNKNAKPLVASESKGSKPEEPKAPPDIETRQGDPKPIRITGIPSPDTWYKAYVCATMAMVLTTIALAIIGFCGIRTANRSLKAVRYQGRTMQFQLRAMERQIDVMKDQTAAARVTADAAKASAEAAQLNAQAFISSERPWIIVELETLAHKDKMGDFRGEDGEIIDKGGAMAGKHVEFRLHVKNVGRTPAHVIHWEARWGQFKEGKEFSPQDLGTSCEANPGNLVPRGERITLHELNRKTMFGTIADSGELCLNIVYTDLILKEEHRTFMLYHLPGGNHLEFIPTAAATQYT